MKNFEFALNAEEVLNYERQGFVVCPSMIPTSTLDPLCGALDKALSAGRQPGGSADGEASSRRPATPRTGALQNLWSASPDLTKIAFNQSMSEAALALSRSAEIQLLGDKAISYRWRANREADWRQDMSSWPGEHFRALSAWIVLDASPHYRRFHFIPGSHKLRQVEGSRARTALGNILARMYAEGFSMSQPVEVEATAGMVLFCNGCVFSHLSVDRQGTPWRMYKLIYLPGSREKD
ncbi:MAG: phytanoyl-CoA dioxygenase family protein [Armatimonadetes bacterium]|nr:phytanoyl-CoA dioxygenase family protein [Armatimonadota bacterium]